MFKVTRVFQYSIGDAAASYASPWAHLVGHFQYSIGDAAHASQCVETVRTALSILHWRCAPGAGAASGPATERAFNTPLEMLHGAMAGATGLSGNTFNTPLEMRVVLVSAMYPNEIPFNTPLEMPAG